MEWYRALGISLVPCVGTFLIGWGIVSTEVEHLKVNQKPLQMINEKVVHMSVTQEHVLKNVQAIGTGLQATSDRVLSLENNSRNQAAMLDKLNITLDSLNKSINNLDNTVGRLDERVKDLEEGGM